MLANSAFLAAFTADSFCILTRRAIYPAILFLIFLLGIVFPSIFLLVSNRWSNLSLLASNCFEDLLTSVDFIRPISCGLNWVI